MKKSFGSRLRDLRGSQSQAAVAAVFGIAQQTYAGWEKDQRKPDLTELCGICTHYAVKADWMLGLDDGAPTNAEDPKALTKRCLDAEQRLSRVNKALGFILKGTHELQSIIEEGERK